MHPFNRPRHTPCPLKAPSFTCALSPTASPDAAACLHSPLSPQEILDEDDLLPEIGKNAAGLSPANRSTIGQGGGAGGGAGAPVGCKQALKTAKSWRQPRPSAENMRASTHAPPDATALLSSLAALPSSPVSSNGGGSPSKTPPWFRVPQLSQRASQTPPSPSKRSPKGENPPSGAAEMV